MTHEIKIELQTENRNTLMQFTENGGQCYILREYVART